jgi:hypothetical protein
MKYIGTMNERRYISRAAIAFALAVAAGVGTSAACAKAVSWNGTSSTDGSIGTAPATDSSGSDGTVNINLVGDENFEAGQTFQIFTSGSGSTGVGGNMTFTDDGSNGVTDTSAMVSGARLMIAQVPEPGPFVLGFAGLAPVALLLTMRKRSARQAQ